MMLQRRWYLRYIQKTIKFKVVIYREFPLDLSPFLVKPTYLRRARKTYNVLLLLLDLYYCCCSVYFTINFHLLTTHIPLSQSLERVIAPGVVPRRASNWIHISHKKIHQPRLTTHTTVSSQRLFWNYKLPLHILSDTNEKCTVILNHLVPHPAIAEGDTPFSSWPRISCGCTYYLLCITMYRIHTAVS